MISHRFRCVFVHIPKTAGQSIEHFFLRLHSLSWKQRAPLLLGPNDDPSRGPPRLAHLYASEYVDRGYVPRTEFQRYFKFTFVRNPWDRLVSEYLYRGRGLFSSFRRFVRSAGRHSSQYSDLSRHLAPQVSYVYGPDDGLLVDFVGRFENLQTDFATVCARLGLVDPTLPHVNASRQRAGGLATRLLSRFPGGRDSYVDFYDESLKHIVAERYAADIEKFGYEFDAGASAVSQERCPQQADTFRVRKRRIPAGR